MNRNTFNNLITTAAWQELFITEMGWNNPQGQRSLPTITIDDISYDFSVVAQRNGFHVLSCKVTALPTMSLCRKIDMRLRRQANDYICIFQLNDTDHHLWACPVKRNEKRDIVLVEYGSTSQADFLYSKVAELSFEIDEQTTIIDVKTKVGQAFAINSEKITKDFYSGFRRQHQEFASFITGIDDHLPLYDKKEGELNRNKIWYASVMLNRLMFCYFIQKKGFLAGDTDYLSHRLKQVQEQEGNGKFYRSFYRDFLISLFHDGLNTPRHTPDWERRFGRIPYLNGGMFDIHTIEQQYNDIDIADEAFASLFAFFDTWQWHLDTRISATGRDINPDVLGYIFEQYINDRAAMGAYYTKEDITEYISRNCIVPFLMDRVAESTSRDAFRPDGEVWKRLRESGSRYIYDAVCYGHTADWRNHLPDDIACGLITPDMEQEYCHTPVGELPDGHIPLAQLRNQWNRPTPPDMGLPTEIWRETIERLERVDTLLAKISSGEITSANDFITLNLDLRSFVYDLLSTTTDHLIVANFYKALQAVTILDPTCGSGAFLFAAMGILEPLYEVCILRMQEWNEQNPNLFRDELQKIRSKYRSNIQYFIYKSIILRNLYGVDIMVEATEIAKLRLFLKMVAVVEVDKRADNMGLDPLPDIDFNIRCGNTLVGYANKDELEKDLMEGDMFANLEFRAEIEKKLQVVSRTYDIFRDVQLTQGDDRDDYIAAKTELREKLAELNDLLSHRLFSANGGKDYNEYLRTHQPFHWLAEFYTIIHGNGGFDVVIGNPPYVEIAKNPIPYSLSLYKHQYKDLYGYVLLRALSIAKPTEHLGFIIPISFNATPGFNTLLEEYSKNGLCISTYADSAKMFQVTKRLSIIISFGKQKRLYITHYIKGNVGNNEGMAMLYRLADSPYQEINSNYKQFNGIPPKISFSVEKSIVSKVFKQGTQYVGNFCTKAGNTMYYTRSIRNFRPFFTFLPIHKGPDGEDKRPTEMKELVVCRDFYYTINCFLNSNLSFMLLTLFTDVRNINPGVVVGMPINTEISNNQQLKILSKSLNEDFERNKEWRFNKTNKCTEAYYYPKLSKPIIDEIDTVLARHYGFTEEELDFIINYDIKYRMGDELNSDNE